MLKYLIEVIIAHLEIIIFSKKKYKTHKENYSQERDKIVIVRWRISKRFCTIINSLEEPYALDTPTT